MDRTERRRTDKALDFELVGFAPSEKRPVLIYHDQLHIGKFQLLEFTEKTPSR